jgi:hypothetical protein
MLTHLVTAHPGGDWGYYLDASGGLRYERAIIAGISHGASSTGLYASRRPFSRAVMHSGGWGAPGDSPATPSIWNVRPRTASIELYCGLNNDRTEPPIPSVLRLVWNVFCRLETSIEGMT